MTSRSPKEPGGGASPEARQPNDGSAESEAVRGSARSLSNPRDLALYFRTLGYLGRYKAAVLLAVFFMIGESLASVFSIGLFKPVLDLIFEERIDTMSGQAAEYPLEIGTEEDAPRLELSGYLFLPAHLLQLEEALQGHPEVQSLDLSRVHYLGDGALRRIEERFDLDVREAPSTETFHFAGENPHGWMERTKIGLLSGWSLWLYDLQVQASQDRQFAYRLLMYTMLVFIGAMLVKVFFGFFASYMAKRIGYRVVEAIRNQLYGHLLSLDFAYFGRRPVGDLMSVATADISEVQQIITLVFSRFLQTPIQFIITFVAMIVISPMLTLISVVAVVPLAVVLLVVSRQVRKASRRVQKHRAVLNSVLHETFSGIRTVKAYNMERRESERFGQRNRRLFRQQVKGAVYSEAASQFNEIIMTLLVVAILLLGGYFVLIATGRYSLDGSMYVVYLLLLVQLFRPLRAWSKSLVKIQSGLAGAERIFAVLDAHPSIVDLPGAVDYEGRDAGIEFRDVVFEYDRGRPVLKNIDLEIPQGSMLALVGPAGCGKSTLANLVPRFYDVKSGEVRVGGRDVRGYTLRSLRSKIAVVSQHVVIFDDTVRYNIAYGRDDITEEEIEGAARAANIHDEIMAMPEGYETFVGGGGMRLSGGQRQRVAIARALLKGAPILILDEATSSLDVENERLIQESLDRLVEGRTVIVIAHRLSTVRDADSICCLSEGRIVERGTHEELLDKNGLYAEFHRISMASNREELASAK